MRNRPTGFQHPAQPHGERHSTPHRANPSQLISRSAVSLTATLLMNQAALAQARQGVPDNAKLAQLTSSSSASSAAAATHTIDIPPGDLADALKTLAKQTGADLVYRPEQVSGIKTSGVKGELTTTEAINRLLRGTTLTLSTNTAGAMLISEPKTSARSSMPGGENPAELTSGSGKQPDTTQERPVATSPGTRGADDNPQSRDSESEERVEQVVVTAQKREERLMDVPISISVLKGDYLDKSTSRAISEELARVPGVSFLEDLNGSGQIAIRGVTVSTPLSGGASTAAYYLDSVPFGFVKSAYVPDANAYDIDRVEVLRGPQGTLYGASALTGVIRILTKDADLNNFELKARGLTSSTQHGGESYRADTAVNVPIIEGKLAARAVVGYQDLGGWIDKPLINRKDANESLIKTARLKVNAQPTDRLSVSAFAWFSRDHRDNLPSSIDGKQNFAPIGEPQANDYDTYGVKLGYDAGAFSIAAVSGYIDYKLLSDFFSILSLPAAQDQTAHTFSQEITLNSTSKGPWRWTAGAIYRDSKDKLETRIPSLLPAPGTNGNLSKSSAVFGELARSFLGGRLELTGGLRYFEDKVSLEELSRLAAVQPSVYESAEDKFHSTTPRLILTWHANEALTTYASYGEGFRSGVLQSPGILGLGIPAAEPDKLKNYEIGAKGALFDDRLTFDTAVYYNKWLKVQRAVVAQSPINGLFYNALINGTSASGAGIDFGVTFKPIRAVTLGLNAGWNDLRMDADVVTGQAATVLFRKGDRLDNSPEITVGAFADYEFPIGASGIQGKLSASSNYISAQDLRSLTGTTVSVVYSDATVITRAGVSLIAPKGWTVTLFVDNIGNEQGLIVPPSPNPTYSIRPQPRTVGLQLDFRM